jgi:hypothetical protein
MSSPHVLPPTWAGQSRAAQARGERIPVEEVRAALLAGQFAPERAKWVEDNIPYYRLPAERNIAGGYYGGSSGDDDWVGINGTPPPESVPPLYSHEAVHGTDYRAPWSVHPNGASHGYDEAGMRADLEALAQRVGTQAGYQAQRVLRDKPGDPIHDWLLLRDYLGGNLGQIPEEYRARGPRPSRTTRASRPSSPPPPRHRRGSSTASRW